MMQIKFETPSVEVGHCVRVKNVVTSQLHGYLTFSEKNVCFTGDCLTRKFIHDGSGSGDSDGGLFESEEDLMRANTHLFPAPDADDTGSGSGSNKKDSNRRPSLASVVQSTTLSPSKASLVFPARKPVSFSFLLFVPEHSLSSSALATDPTLFVERLQLIMAVPCSSLMPSAQAALTSEDGVEAQAVANGRTDNENTTSPPVTSTPHDGFKRVIFNVSALSRTFITKRESTSFKGLTLKDMMLFLPRADCPALLQVDKLAALVEMISPKPLPAPAAAPAALSLTTPLSASSHSSSSLLSASAVAPTITLLQGPVQRIDVVFRSNGNCVLNGKVYLSSDLPTVSNGMQQHMFWYPDVSSVTNEETDCDNAAVVDTIKFHPFRLNSSFQPSIPLQIPHQADANSIFCLPLFVKSEIHATVTVKLMLEYVPKKRLSTSVTKDFEFKVPRSMCTPT
jgi:hypothetical protein